MSAIYGKNTVGLNRLRSAVGRMFTRIMLGATAFIMFMLVLMNPGVHAESGSWKEEKVSFQSGETTLNGTVLAPVTPGRHPAIVLVHGSNSTNREKYRAEAEMFAKAGIVTLIYDKRSDGFSKSRTGGRSYALLADDAIAAMNALGSRTDVDDTKVGLWGVSEGAWVVSLAASQSDKAAFVIMAGASGVPPVQQQSWQLVNRLYDQGVTSPSMIQSVTRNGIQLAVTAGLFAEATYDPVPAFERLKQPVLAIWGANDRIEPALESSQTVEAALKRGGNPRYTIQIFPKAGHLLRESPDGVKQLDTFAAGYGEAMTSWVTKVAEGHAPGPGVIGPKPVQDRLSPEGIANIAWYQSAWVQLGTALVLMIVFLSYLVSSFVRWIRQRGTNRMPLATGRLTYALAVTGSLTIIGFIGYFGFLMSSGVKNVAPVVLDRPVAWIVLQILAIASCLLTAWLARSCWISRSVVTGAEKIRTVTLLVGGIVLVLWIMYWRLLV